jgi:hypothetical protein
MTPDVLWQRVASVVDESTASSICRVAYHWPDNHQSQAMIKLFQILNYSAFMPCNECSWNPMLCHWLSWWCYYYCIVRWRAQVQIFTEGCSFWQVFFLFSRCILSNTTCQILIRTHYIGDMFRHILYLQAFFLLFCSFPPCRYHGTVSLIGDQIPMGTGFFTHIQTGPGAHPASCTMGIGSFPGVKRLGHGADHPPPPSAEVENE